MQASQRKIPILIDAERKREGLDELLNFASYVVCSAKFPQVSCFLILFEGQREGREFPHDSLILAQISPHDG